MDLDKPLEDIIADKRKSEPRKSDTRKAPRTSTGNDRRAPGATPYARPAPRSTEDKWVHDAYQGGGRDSRGGGGGGAAAVVAGTGAGFTGVSTRIEVIGLHYEVTATDLKLERSFKAQPSVSNIAKAAHEATAAFHAQDVRWVKRQDKNAYAPRVSPSSLYDRSGRSKGEATMEFASPQQAKIAINKFDGAMTKGQTISIHLLPPIVAKGRPGPGSAGGASNGGAASGQSLLSRIQGSKPTNAPSAGAQRGPRGGRGGAGRGRGAPSSRGGGGGGGGRRGPTSQGDLDKELDGFMTNSADVDMA